MAQVYVDDIIFGFTKDDLAQDFFLTMQNEFGCRIKTLPQFSSYATERWNLPLPSQVC